MSFVPARKPTSKLGSKSRGLIFLFVALLALPVIGLASALAAEPGEGGSGETPTVEEPAKPPGEPETPPVTPGETETPVETPSGPTRNETPSSSSQQTASSTPATVVSGGGGSTTTATTTSGGGHSRHSGSSGSSGGGGGGSHGSGASTGAGLASPKGTTAPSNSSGGGGGDSGSGSSGSSSDIGSTVTNFISQALPTTELEQLGSTLVTRAGLAPVGNKAAQKRAVNRLSKALGTALLGSAVSVTPVNANSGRGHHPSAIAFIPDKPTGVYLILLAVIAAVVAALIAIQVLPMYRTRRWVRARLDSFGGPKRGPAAQPFIDD